MFFAVVLGAWCLLWWGLILILWGMTGVWRRVSFLTLVVAWVSAPVWTPGRLIRNRNGVTFCLFVAAMALWIGGRAVYAR